MVITREFLDVKRPPLQSAAEWLISRYRREAVVDMRPAIVVLPGSRAGRRLLEILVTDCESQGLFLTPPSLETVGRFPESVYRPRRPFASDLTQRLVWAETLRAASAEQLAPIFPRPPVDSRSSQWFELADLVKRQHIELAGDGLDFAQVAKTTKEIGDPAERARWQALARLQQNYHDRLDALELWDRQTARLVAIQKRECQTDRDVILIGAVDLNVTMRQMLRQIADRVTALIFASTDLRDRFDDYGCLVPERWAEAELPIATDQVVVVDGPAEQADAVVERLASFSGKYPADDVVIGVPDEQLIPQIQRALASVGVDARWGPGQPISHSTPARLLKAVTACLDPGRFSDFASVLRHCDIEQWLRQFKIGPEILEQLDEYHGDHLPFQLEGKWLGKPDNRKSLERAWKKLDSLIAPLRQPPQKLIAWRAPILQLLSEVYGKRLFDRARPEDRFVLSACQAIRDVLDSHSQIPDAIMPVVSAAEAVRWTLQEASSETVAAMPNPESVELLGWLELPLDDSPALVVTGFNEGFVPESMNSDIFLPNALRQRLGMLDNQRRYARDAFAVTLLTHSKQSIQWIVGRRNQDGDPLKPSRLLFAVDADRAARRALKFFGPQPARPRVSNDPLHSASLAVPRPKPLKQPITKLHVTAFRDYLACPYRFYLRHVLHLEEQDDSAREMDGRLFGNAAHSVLSEFGVSDVRDSTDADVIRQFLNDELSKFAAVQFGTHPLPAVHVQIEQLRLRLNRFAEVQAERAKQGWRIELVEGREPRSQVAEIDVDGEPFMVTGRIDRIDHHPDTDERVIWDYKTSDQGPLPDAAHRKNDTWVDLQLPLYRHLARSLGIESEVKFGYITLPRDTRSTKFCIAEWLTQDLDEADEVARQVIRQIRLERFWPPAAIPPAFSEEFANICQDGVLGGMEDEAEVE